MYLPIAMLVVKYKSPIGRTQEENNPMKIPRYVLERKKQRFRQAELRQFGGLRLNRVTKRSKKMKSWTGQHTNVLCLDQNNLRRLKESLLEAELA